MSDDSVNRYQILSRLGEGASGEVFLAYDPEMDRRVALKTLRPEWADDPVEWKRLRDEARTLAQLDHPNIARALHFLREGDRAHIVMELVPGPTLATRLKNGPLDVFECLQAARQLASALSSAHAKGIFHRDIKPGNIRFTDEGQIKLLDFGLARRVRFSSTSGFSSVTASLSGSELGHFVGTLPYMPPEVIEGRSTDQRGDIYSLGVTLFEMLTGRRPFDNPDPAALIASISSHPTPTATSVNPRVSRRVSAIVARMMAREPGERFMSARDVEEALVVANRDEAPGWQRLVVWGTLLGLLVPAYFLWKSGCRDHRIEVVNSKAGRIAHVLAVVPFAMSSPDPADAYLADGLSVTLRTALWSLGLPISYSPVGAAAQLEDNDPQAVMSKTGADLVVGGQILRQDQRLRVTLWLLTRGSPGIQWTEELTASLDEASQLPDRTATAVVGALSSRAYFPLILPPLVGEGHPSTEAPALTVSFRTSTALRHYTRAQTLLADYRSGTHLEDAIKAFELTTSEDPGSALAFSGLANALLWKYDLTRDTRWLDGASNALARGEQVDPKNVLVILMRAELATRRGHTEEARALLTLLTDQMPGSDAPWAALGTSYWSSGEYSKAEVAYREAVLRRPDDWDHQNELGRALRAQKKFAGAESSFVAVMRLKPDDPLGSSNLATVFLSAGDTLRGEQTLRQSIAIGKTTGNLSTLAYILFSQRRYPEAVELYRQVAELVPGRFYAWRNLGDAQLAAQDSINATSSFDRICALSDSALALNPRDMSAHRYRALALAKLGRFAAARTALKAGLNLKSDDKDLLYTGAVIEALAHHNPEALAYLKQALTQGIPRPDARADADLRSLWREPVFLALTQGS